MHDQLDMGVGMDEHVAEIASVLREALRLAAEAHPGFADELYILNLDVDGQYHTVTVGVSNITDFVRSRVPGVRVPIARRQEMKNFECTCPVCRKAHVVQAVTLSSPRSLISTDGRLLPSCSCGEHSREQIVAAR
jgi:hypothetical protein